MSKVFIMATSGSEDPTRAGLAFLFAKGVIEAGHEPEIALVGDGAILSKQSVAEGLHPVGLPPLKDLIAFARENKVPVFT